MVLSLETRKKIQECFDSGMTVLQTAKKLEMSPSTLHREKKKCVGKYDAEEADGNTSKGMHPIDDITGQKYFHLTVLRLVGFTKNIRRRTVWECKCDCGAICFISKKMLSDYCSKDRALSCGCVAKQSKGPQCAVPIEEAALRKYQDLLTFRKIKGRCWEWTGYRQKGKTPKTSWKNKGMSVRKCMYMLMHGITEECNSVHTTCGNLCCFNPEHLTLDIPTPRHFYKDEE